jgi:hypothetical protein
MLGGPWGWYEWVWTISHAIAFESQTIQPVLSGIPNKLLSCRVGHDKNKQHTNRDISRYIVSKRVTLFYDMITAEILWMKTKPNALKMVADSSPQWHYM